MTQWNTWNKLKGDLTAADVMQAYVSGVWTIAKLRADMTALQLIPLVVLSTGDRSYLAILQTFIGNYDSHPF